MKLNPEEDYNKVIQTNCYGCYVLSFENHHHDELDSFYYSDGSSKSLADEMFEKFRKQFDDYSEKIEAVYGTPKLKSYDWSPGIPTFASSGFYAQWNIDGDAICLFVNADNPGDPTFLILGKCKDQDIDYTPGADDPWRGQWHTQFNESHS